MLRYQTLIQAIGEAVIPLAGFFFFDWDLYFILLFYCIDLIITEVFVFLKAKKIITYKSKNLNTALPFLLKNITLVLFLIILMHAAIYFIQPGINFQQAFIDFVMYEEAGIPIPQGLLLLPLVFFGNFQQYKLFFLVPAKYRTKQLKQVYSLRRNALLIGIFGATLALLLSFALALPQLIFLILLVIAKFFVDLKLSDR